MPGIAIHYINLGVACDRQLKLAGYPTQGARMILLFALAIASYLIGAIPFGFIAGWLKGVDLRAVGSGNIGATNAGRVLGKKWGYAVFALDFGKGALGAFLGRLALNDEMPASLTPAVCGAAAFLGHMFPVYLRFQGGKGVATGAGVIASMVPGAFACALLVWLMVVLATRMISAGSVAASMVLIIWAGAKLLADPTNPAAVLVLFSGIFVIAKHLGNIRRILAGNENLLADGPLFHVMPGKLVLATGSAWLGMGLFFTFVTGLGTFGAFELLVMEEPRPYWLPAPESFSREPEKGLYLPEPLRKEQGSLLAGVSVSAQFPWYFLIQSVLGTVMLGAIVARRPRKTGWILLAALSLGLAATGWAVERHVESLRVSRNAITARYVTSADSERISISADLRSARGAFRQAHSASIMLNLATLACVAGLTLRELAGTSG